MTQLQEPINLIKNDLMTSNSLFNSSVTDVNDYLAKINTLQYLQNNNPNIGYQISIPSSDSHLYTNNNFTSKGQLQIDVTQNPYNPEEDFSKL